MNWNDALKWAAGLVLFGAWVALVVLKMTPVEPLVGFIGMTLGFLARHVVGGPTVYMPPQVASTAPPTAVQLPNGDTRPSLYIPGQTGSYHLGSGIIFAIVLFAIAFAVEGCAAINDQVGPQVKALHDDEVVVWKAMACNTPVGALGRHPEIVGPVYAICFPGAVAAPPIPPASGAVK